MLLWLFGSLVALHFHDFLGKPLAGLLILRSVHVIMSEIFVLIVLRESCMTVSCCSLQPSPCTAPCFFLPLHCTACGCSCSCSSPHSLPLARHPLGWPRHSSHPVELLPIQPCGRCRRSSHARGRTFSSSQPLALTAGSRLQSLVPWAGLTNPPSPPT